MMMMTGGVVTITRVTEDNDHDAVMLCDVCVYIKRVAVVAGW
jgi:hypothetical protein